MGRMSDLHIQICEDLQTDSPTHQQIQDWFNEHYPKEAREIEKDHTSTTKKIDTSGTDTSD